MSIAKKEIPEYLLAIMLPPEIADLIKQWKLLLRKEIGEFGSQNSLAHITIMVFDTDLFPLKYFIHGISEFCDNYFTHEIGFEGFDSFGNSTFYVKPDKNSRKYINATIRKLHRHFQSEIKNVSAHMTIARKLNDMTIRRAFEVFEKYQPDFKFVCDCFVLRKFNSATGQYSDVISEFKFSEQQLRLF